MAKKRTRTPATRDGLDEARARTVERPSRVDERSSTSEPQLPLEPEPQMRPGSVPVPPPRSASPAPRAPGRISTRRRAGGPRRAEPRVRYARLVEELDLVALMRQEFLDAKAAVAIARDAWLDAADEAFGRGVMIQDVAEVCGITRSGLYQALKERRQRR